MVLDSGGGDGDTTTSSSTSGDSSILPSWVSALKVLAPVAGTLAVFASSPREFILEHVLTFFVGLFIQAGAVVAGAFEEVWLIVGRSFVDAFDPLFSGGAMIAEAVSELLETVNAALLELVTVAGPVAPIVVMLVWVVIAIVATLIVRWVLLATPYVGQWI